VKIRYTTILPEDILNQTKEKAKEEGCGGNAIIEKALRLYFSSHLPNEVWEKSLESGWIKKVVLLDDGILFENIMQKNHYQLQEGRIYPRSPKIKRLEKGLS